MYAFEKTLNQQRRSTIALDLV